ncbi:Rha family regulatory protein [Vibrio phage 1.231.O._10N.261.49.F8]|nr:Rha family regulatory protein [Vibrio phage 1.119.O._10N.261.51.A9]AUR89656.1 Rha family regulatory protein [Vibrio phage 1.127.O._10N.286.52.E12]AUR90432.1 Rha family regulatory protein [Vibrio phage 1.143.O._10N.261.55.C8]AUR96718.1 Rha family regulatory protein [Vibrio phage 1.231.O._10N.261.49.F8]
MNIIAANQNLTMSSREIAELTGKEHKNVTRTIESLMSGGILTAQIEPLSYEHRGNWYRFYELNKRDCLVVVARLSPEFTAAIVDRWQELEKQLQPKIPTNFAEALQLAADQAKALELAAPKVAFVDSLVDRTSLMNASQVAQKHKKSAIWLNKILTELKVYNKAVKRGKVFQQWFVDKGYGEMKQTEVGHPQALFTTAGEVWINEKLITEGVI